MIDLVLNVPLSSWIILMSSANKTAEVPRSRVGIGIILKIQANNFPADTGDTSFGSKILDIVSYWLHFWQTIPNNWKELLKNPSNDEKTLPCYLQKSTVSYQPHFELANSISIMVGPQGFLKCFSPGFPSWHSWHSFYSLRPAWWLRSSQRMMEAMWISIIFLYLLRYLQCYSRRCSAGDRNDIQKPIVVDKSGTL